MSRISSLLESILNSVYGRDVRQSIHDSIQECYNDVTKGKTLADAAADNANAAANNADLKASLADQKAALANTAADTANTAADDANASKTACDNAVAQFPERVEGMFADLGFVKVDGKICVEVERE